MAGPIPKETVFFYLDRPDNDETFTLRIDPNMSAANLRNQLAEKVANIIGGIQPNDIEDVIEISDGVTIVGEAGCNSITDLRQIEHKEGVGRRDITAICIRILGDPD
jgi:hypothetical protein